jgi:hypothetical protein
MRAAARSGTLAVLEVNAPVIDYPGSPKHLLDRALLVEPMRRWRDWQCRAADLIVSPSRAILPAWVQTDRIVELEWGADTELFRPGAVGSVPFARRPGDLVAVFAGAFRAWHGAIHLVHAIRHLRSQGIANVTAVLAGDGPELPRVRAAADGLEGVTFTGPVAHDAMPALIAAGLDGLHAIQPCCGGMDLVKLKANYGGKILFNGAIDSHHALIKGTPESVRRSTRETLAVMAPGGGYVAGASHDSILEETPVENVVAMFDAVREFGLYPIKKTHS